ncbi:MAG: class I SAM-dependent methyltransferase [Planctomycetes bacterium]|nr:class I SAM-dependent methyltransferase [Planctomycetota bacterium]
MHGPPDVLQMLAHPPGVKLFEGSCGRGKLTRELLTRGFEITVSSSGEPPDFGPHVRCLPNVDLNRDLPIADGSFDCAVLQEVIEHLENPAHVVREFSRILRPGGWWVLTTPNSSGAASRLHFLLTGFVKGRRRPANYARPPGIYQNLFVPPLPVLHYLLWQYGFRVKGIGRTRRRFWAFVPFVLLYPFIRVWTYRYARPLPDNDTPLQREACRDLRRILLSPSVLMDENLVLLLEKTPNASAYRPESAKGSRAGGDGP